MGAIWVLSVPITASGPQGVQPMVSGRKQSQGSRQNGSVISEQGMALKAWVLGLPFETRQGGEAGGTGKTPSRGQAPCEVGGCALFGGDWWWGVKASRPGPSRTQFETDNLQRESDCLIKT